MSAVVGRDRELAEIVSFLELADGSPRVLLIEGEAGIGKTTLWRAGVDEARGRRHRVLSCAGAESEAQLSFAALRDALGDAFAEIAADLPAPQRHALAVTLLLEEDPTPQEPAVIAAASLSALRALARRAPIVIAVDDIQWLDEPSADVLAYVSRRLGDDPVAMLLARRRGEEPGPLALERLGDRLAVLSVAGMTVGALGRVLNDRVGATYPRPTLRRVHEVSGGNPFYAIELARALGDATALSPGETPPVLGTLRDLVRTRLSALPAETLDVLAVAAAVRQPSLAAVEAALGADPTPALVAAEAAHVAEREDEEIHFAHPLFAAGAYELLRAADRRDVHRRLAAVVSDPEERAGHLALAAEGPDEEIATLLEQGASAAFARGSPSTAAELMELAIRLSPATPAERVVERQAEQGRYYVMAGNLAEAAAVLEPAVEKLPGGAKRADALLNLAQACEGHSLDEAIGLSEAALEDARGDDLRAARIEGYLGAVLGQRDGASEEAMRHLRAAIRAAERSGDETCLMEALMNLGNYEFLFAPRPTPGVVERAVGLEDGGLRIWPIHRSPSALLGLRLYFGGRLNEARERLELAVGRAASTGDEYSEAVIRLFLTELECKAGDWQLAARYASEGYELAELVGQNQLLSTMLYGRALIEAHLGRVEDARASAERGLGLARSSGDRVFRFQNLAVLGFLDLSTGDHAAASRVLRALAEEAASSGWADPGFSGELPNAIEALVELGELGEAERLLAELEGRLTIVESPWAAASAARCRGMILAARGDFPHAFEAFAVALAVHEELPQPFDRARTLLALGKAQRRARQRAAARETLGTALAIFEELGAELWAVKAREELARIGGRRSSEGDLTPSEQRIAELVAEGKTNKEVAAILVVADRTIESALTQIYRKLDVRSRTELARRLAAPG